MQSVARTEQAPKRLASFLTSESQNGTHLLLRDSTQNVTDYSAAAATSNSVISSSRTAKCLRAATLAQRAWNVDVYSSSQGRTVGLASLLQQGNRWVQQAILIQRISFGRVRACVN